MSLVPNSTIRIDNFAFMKNDLTRYTFLLTHCHEDHIKGLHSSWNYGQIYCSPVSALLISERFPNLKPLVNPLELDEPHWIYTDEQQKEGVTLTLIDANHCPGAVMFLI